MAWIRTLGDQEATGVTRRAYEAAVQRAGKVFNVVRIMGINGPVLERSMALYGALAAGPGPLDGAQRQLLATVVSRVNGCVY